MGNRHWLLAALSITWLLTACSDPQGRQGEEVQDPVAVVASPEPETAAPPAEAPPPLHQASIASSALTPYSADQFPETAEKYGDRLKDVENYRKLAAQKAAAIADCKEISMVEVANTSTINDLRFWVECSDLNGDPVRYNFTEKELREAG